jgi:hypothetical protein
VLTGLPMLSQTSQQSPASTVPGTNANPTTSEEPVPLQLTYCPTHTQKKIKFFCKNDSEMFCSKCILKHTSQKHDVINCSPKSNIISALNNQFL